MERPKRTIVPTKKVREASEAVSKVLSKKRSADSSDCDKASISEECRYGEALSIDSFPEAPVSLLPSVQPASTTSGILPFQISIGSMSVTQPPSYNAIAKYTWVDTLPEVELLQPGSTSASWVWTVVLKLRFPHGPPEDRKTHLCLLCAEDLIALSKTNFKSALCKTKTASNAVTHVQHKHIKHPFVAPHFQKKAHARLLSTQKTLTSSALAPSQNGFKCFPRRNIDGGMTIAVREMSDQLFARYRFEYSAHDFTFLTE